MKNEIVKTQGMSKGYKIGDINVRYILTISEIKNKSEFVLFNAEFTNKCHMSAIIQPISLLVRNLAKYRNKSTIYAHVTCGKDTVFEFMGRMDDDYYQSSFRNWTGGKYIG